MKFTYQRPYKSDSRDLITYLGSNRTSFPALIQGLDTHFVNLDRWRTVQNLQELCIRMRLIRHF